MARTIQSPGVEIKEVDLSLRPNLPVGTTVFIPGFANQGPTDELLTVSSLSEFEQIYGLPQNAAERYMYHSVKAVFQSPANVLVSRLPYGQGAGATVADKYSVQVYPVIPRPIIVDGAAPEINSIEKDKRIVAWHPKSDLDTGTKRTASYNENGIIITANEAGGDGNVSKTQAPKNSTQLTITDLFAGEDVTISAGGDKIVDPETVIAVAGGEDGDYVVTQSASAYPKFSENPNLVITTNEGGADKNDWTVVLNLSAEDNSNTFDPVSGVFTINTTSKRFTGKSLQERINFNFSDRLSADGGLDDTAALFASANREGVQIDARVAGDAGNVPLTAFVGVSSTVIDQGAEVTADVAGVAGDITLEADLGSTATVTDQGAQIDADVIGAAGNVTLVADTGSTATVTDQGAQVDASVIGAAGNVTLTAFVGLSSTATSEGVTYTSDKAGIAGDVTLTADIGAQATVTSGLIQLTADEVGAADITLTIDASNTDTVDQIVTAYNAANPLSTISVDAGGSEIPIADLVLTGGSDAKTAQDLIDDHNAIAVNGFTLSITNGSTTSIPTIDVTVAGGADGSTVQVLVDAFNGDPLNVGNELVVTSGGTVVPTLDLVLAGGSDPKSVQDLVDAHNLANVGNELTVVAGGTIVPTLDLVLAGGSDPKSVQDLVDEHNLADFTGNTLTVIAGGTVVPTLDLVLTGGINGSTVQDLVDAHNGANPDNLLDITSGNSVILTTDLALTGGADLIPSADSFFQPPLEHTITFTGGVSRGLSTKVVPVGEWIFSETNPGGYQGTTVKDAVDSVLAGIESLSALSQNDLYWTEAEAGDPLSIPALNAYEIPEVSDLIADAVNSVGWDLSASDRYYLGEPSNIELTNDEFQKTIKGEIKLSQANAGKLENQKFTTYNDLLTKGGAGMMIVNDKKFVLNEKFEGYYIGISDNTNLNPATDFDSVGHLKSLSKKLGGTTGGYVNVPDSGTKSRLTFSLSAGFIFDQYGNKQQVGLDGSMSEALENLSEFDLNTDEFSDVLTLAVFKVRQSTLEPDATKLDYLVADSVIGSVNYFREAFKSTGGTATSYFIESEASNSNNLYMKFNEGISKDAGNWLDENGYPTRKIRVLPSKSVSYYDELSTNQQEATTQEVNDFKVAQAFLNGNEEKEDRLYIKSWQDLQASRKAQIKHGNNVYPHGVYRKQAAAAKETGNIPAKLDRIFELADNFDLFPIDITIESGLGTVYVGTDGGTVESFDDEEFFNIGDHVVSSTGLSGSGLYTTKLIDNRSEINYLTQYDTIFDTFKSFSQFARKDNIFIADPLRYIFVQGRNSKTLTSQQREAGVNFSQHIYWPLRHMMTGGTKNSSYCCTYANWGFTNDKALNRGVWVPMSGFAAAAMGNTDSNFYPWIAPAGFTRGLVSGIQDLAFYPKQKERDQLYKIGLNPVANFPNEGFAIFGQKTMQAKPSAFDRINVRRLFLYLQKATMNTVKYFVFEPNTLFTRTQVLNVLRPIFEEVKNTQGMYDYLLVCDERNNSPDVIDRNELVIDIYIKPTRAAEFILVNFYATRTGQDFSELVS